jgi:hypothetical protein
MCAATPPNLPNPCVDISDGVVIIQRNHALFLTVEFQADGIGEHPVQSTSSQPSILRAVDMVEVVRSAVLEVDRNSSRLALAAKDSFCDC